MRRYFHSELESLRNHLVMMGEFSIEIVHLALDGLLNYDLEKAEQVLPFDDRIDNLELEIDREAIRYITLRAPVASDLRLLTTAMKASHDFERVGDEATSIAKRTLHLAGVERLREFVHLPEMSELATGMLRDATNCFIREDLQLARGIPRRDAEVDRLNRENQEAFVEKIAAKPEFAQQAVELMFASKAVERMGDHAKNIAQEVIYLLSGRDTRESVASSPGAAPKR